jgi:hypothetical protein
MILFDLKCDKEHLFEAWFEDSKSFEKQLKNKLVKCPICNTHKISKSIMSPNISSKSNSSSKLNKKKKDTYAAYNKYLKKLKKEVKSNFKYVGKDFSVKARKMHYGELPEKPIYGEASEKEAKDLVNDGVDIVKLPWSVDKKNKN